MSFLCPKWVCGGGRGVVVTLKRTLLKALLRGEETSADNKCRRVRCGSWERWVVRGLLEERCSSRGY